MADVTLVRPTGDGNSDVYEYTMDATDKTMAIQRLDPRKDTTIAIRTTGSATVQVDLYFEKHDNASAQAFTFASAAATASSEDYIKAILGPISGFECTGTITGGDTAIIQVMQSEKE